MQRDEHGSSISQAKKKIHALTSSSVWWPRPFFNTATLGNSPVQWAELKHHDDYFQPRQGPDEFGLQRENAYAAERLKWQRQANKQPYNVGSMAEQSSTMMFEDQTPFRLPLMGWLMVDGLSFQNLINPCPPLTN